MYAFGKHIAKTETSEGFAVRYSPTVSLVEFVALRTKSLFVVGVSDEEVAVEHNV